MRVEVVGAGAGELAGRLDGRGVRARAVDAARASGDVGALVVAGPDVRPRDLPRRPPRVGWIGAEDARGWRTDLLEDLDEAVVTRESDAGTVAPGLVAPPRIAGDGHPGRELADVLDAHQRLPSVAIVTGVSSLRMRQRWGDHHFAVGAAKALRRAGHRTRVLCQAELDQHDLTAVDRVVLLAGKVALRGVPGTPTTAWVISHPDRVVPAALAGLEQVLVASDRFAAALREQGVEASALHQATDPDRFRPTAGGPHHELLFVGNSRGVRRRILDDLPAGRVPAVYGYGWDDSLLDPACLCGEHVPNEQLPAYYTAADVVLNDHWDTMRALAFPSNRLYDAAACGSAVVSDHLDGLDRLFDGAIATYRDRADLARVIDGLLADAGRRRELGERARRVVLQRHTFDHRVPALLGGPGR